MRPAAPNFICAGARALLSRGLESCHKRLDLRKRGLIKRHEQIHGLRAAVRATATGSLLDATRHVEPAAANPVEHVRPLPFQSGVLLCLAGQPVQLEAYDSLRTLAAVWTALLQAAALDALHMPAVSTPGGVPGGSSTRSTRSPSAASRPASVPGMSPFARLTAIVWRGRIVHAVAVNPRHELVAV